MSSEQEQELLALVGVKELDLQRTLKVHRQLADQYKALQSEHNQLVEFVHKAAASGQAITFANQTQAEPPKPDTLGPPDQPAEELPATVPFPVTT